MITVALRTAQPRSGAWPSTRTFAPKVDAPQTLRALAAAQASRHALPGGSSGRWRGPARREAGARTVSEVVDRDAPGSYPRPVPPGKLDVRSSSRRSMSCAMSRSRNTCSAACEKAGSVAPRPSRTICQRRSNMVNSTASPSDAPSRPRRRSGHQILRDVPSSSAGSLSLCGSAPRFSPDRSVTHDL